MYFTLPVSGDQTVSSLHLIKHCMFEQCLNYSDLYSVCKQHLYTFHPDFLGKGGAKRRHPKSGTGLSLCSHHSCGNLLAGGEGRCPLLQLGGRKSRGAGHSNTVPEASIVSG